MRGRRQKDGKKDKSEFRVEFRSAIVEICARCGCPASELDGWLSSESLSLSLCLSHLHRLSVVSTRPRVSASCASPAVTHLSVSPLWTGSI